MYTFCMHTFNIYNVISPLTTNAGMDVDESLDDWEDSSVSFFWFMCVYAYQIATFWLATPMQNITYIKLYKSCENTHHVAIIST